MIKTAIFKVRLDFEGCDIVATTYPNQRIPFSVFSDLHNSIHDTVKEINNQKSWRTRLNYVYSSKTGESFIQYFTNIKVFPCEKCCFLKVKNVLGIDILKVIRVLVNFLIRRHEYVVS